VDLRDIELLSKLEYEWGFEPTPEIDQELEQRATVDFEYADLRDANLEGVRLDQANLKSANLSTTKGLSDAQVEKAFGNAKTQLPSGITRPSKWATEEE
jgi:uncharacterized protein YjbI with pentapeptide repeats